MENLPKNVINKIMFYMSHPVADMLKEEPIFKFLAKRRYDLEYTWHIGLFGACLIYTSPSPRD